ncbi:MAG: FAD:protein FMN transferase [Bacilli bacterium]|jgi:thiamine biosynthesis lipoprotein|nr:FAD:protein FMN transferase [Bacilli bacterium]
MKRSILLLICLCLVIGCSQKQEKYNDSFLSFDTYIEFTGYTSNKKEFDKYFIEVKNSFNTYHKLFDAYQNYDNINNIKSINDNAGIKPVKVNKELFDVINQTIIYYHGANKKNNIALSPIINEYKIVQENYEAGKAIVNPDMTNLKKLNQCTNINNIVLNEAEYTVYLKKQCAKIDVGSIAKGYATDQVAQKIHKDGLHSGIINAGGNVSVIGNKNNKPFTIGIADPNNPNIYILTLNAQDTSIVTSGDYQRYYMIDNKRMSHIIDPNTLLPANINRSVTIVSSDGLIGDYFSTECFMLNEQEIDKLAKKYHFEYIIINKKEKIIVSEGLKNDVKIK